MSIARGGNRRTEYEICPHCGKKKMYLKGFYNKAEACLMYWKHCQYCQYSGPTKRNYL